jgi:hypothetical protein
MPVTHGVAGSSPVQTANSCLFLVFGLVVQLVRIHACHAWGRGFESRPDRKSFRRNSEAFFVTFASIKQEYVRKSQSAISV